MTKTPDIQPPEATTLLTLQETADLLRKSDAQLRWLMHTGAAPRSALIGGRRLFRLTEVNAWIDAQFEEAAA